MNTSSNSIAIQLIGINKKYVIYHDKPTLVEKFIKNKDEIFWALKNINLTIYKGEKIGIVGSNGSGKTTLLKMMAGITTPTSGRITTNGKIISLIDLEAGFHSDFTGEQNIYLNSMLLGMNKQEIQCKISQIIAYAELKQFIDAPLFTYSAGMKLRLGFSIAIHADPQILLLDEGLGVGDVYFREKARKTLSAHYKGNKTIIISAHNADIIKQQCKRIIMLKHGTIIKDGGLNILDEYAQNFKPS